MSLNFSISSCKIFSFSFRDAMFEEGGAELNVTPTHAHVVARGGTRRGQIHPRAWCKHIVMFWRRFNSNFKTGTNKFYILHLSFVGRQLFLLHRRQLVANVKNQQSRRHLWLLIIPFTTFGLGTWQIFRLRWKVDLIDRLQRKMLKSPVPIPFE